MEHFDETLWWDNLGRHFDETFQWDILIRHFDDKFWWNILLKYFDETFWLTGFELDLGSMGYKKKTDGLGIGGFPVGSNKTPVFFFFTATRKNNKLNSDF